MQNTLTSDFIKRGSLVFVNISVPLSSKLLTLDRKKCNFVKNYFEVFKNYTRTGKIILILFLIHLFQHILNSTSVSGN